MKISLIEMEGFLRGKCLPGDMKVNETNAEYLVRKFAEEEAKCAALAAENAGLKAFVDALLSIAWQGGSADGAEIQEMALKHGLLRQEVYSADEHETLVDDPGNFEDGDPVYFRVETPATDAFLAEVRAQGVEMFAAHKRERQQALRSRSMRMSEEAAGMAADAENFADELRKGVQS
ncbi:hypothetical protein [Salmonella enterica]|uniref:hypothetical protein n=1 Tax=Salmonella enterica TaxID=28901 RepID=UPI003CE9815A